MGDFRTASGSPNSGAANAVAKTDYDYDVNGNLLKDLNKEIGGLQTSGIQYNHLNLPYQVAVTNKGTITYIYDASGRKLEKQTLDNTAQGKTTKTAYIGGYVFQDDVLQFIGNEEGRARPKDNGFVFDYFIKDHLGNTRMVLTDEQQTDAYPVASMETATAASEKLYYSNIDETRADKPAGYPEDTYTNPNEKVAKLNGNAKKIGPAILLKVMSGDQMNIRANAYYRLNGASAGTPTNPASELLAALAGSIQGVTGGKFGMQQVQSSGVLGPGISDLLQRQTDQYTGSNRPKAFLNWVLLDEQFKIVTTSTGFEPVGSDGEFKTFVKTGLPISQNGYLYVYTSNESPVDVFFDNLQVTHVRGPLFEETHYYPFGLTMSGISSKAFQSSSPDCGCPSNKKGFNGNEIQNKEFSDGSGLEVYDFNARTYDQQIGRFIQIDPLSEEGDQESLTPYQFSGNNPSTFNDPDGKCPWCWGAIIGAAVEYGTQVASNLAQGKSLSKSLTDVDGKAIAISAGAGALSGGVSAFVPKGAAAKVVVETVKVGIDAAESAAKQYNETGSVSLKTTVTDVVTNKVAGKVTENVKVNSNSTIKTTEKQLDRANRVAAGDPASTGRANTVNKLENKLANQKNANAAAQQAAGGAVSNTAQGVGNSLTPSNNKVQPAFNFNNRPAVDNTAVKKPIILF